MLNSRLICGRYTLLNISFLQGRFTFAVLPDNDSQARVPSRPRSDIIPSQRVPVALTSDGTPTRTVMA